MLYLVHKPDNDSNNLLPLRPLVSAERRHQTLRLANVWIWGLVEHARALTKAGSTPATMALYRLTFHARAQTTAAATDSRGNTVEHSPF